MINLYLCKDEVGERFYFPCMATTDGAAIRGNLIYATREKPITDINFYKVGVVDEVTGVVTPLPKPELCKRDSYKFSEVVAKELNQTEYEKNLAAMQLRQGAINRSVPTPQTGSLENQENENA